MDIVLRVVHAAYNANGAQTVTIPASKDIRILQAAGWINQRRKTTMSKSWGCNCMGPQNGEPFCPCMMNRLGVIKQNGRWVEPAKDLGPVVVPIDTADIFRQKKAMPFSKPPTCTAVDHNAPMHLCVPPGETYIHTCPACGKVSTISPPNITFSEIEDEDAFAAESDEEVLGYVKR